MECLLDLDPFKVDETISEDCGERRHAKSDPIHILEVTGHVIEFTDFLVAIYI